VNKKQSTLLNIRIFYFYFLFYVDCRTTKIVGTCPVFFKVDVGSIQDGIRSRHFTMGVNLDADLTEGGTGERRGSVNKGKGFAMGPMFAIASIAAFAACEAASADLEPEMVLGAIMGDGDGRLTFPFV